MDGVGEFCAGEKEGYEDAQKGGGIYDVPLLDEAEMDAMIGVGVGGFKMLSVGILRVLRMAAAN